jgi:hypothetical protein
MVGSDVGDEIGGVIQADGVGADMNVHIPSGKRE